MKTPECLLFGTDPQLSLASISVLLADPSSEFTKGFYLAGIFVSEQNTLFSGLKTVSFSFLADAPTTSNLSASYDSGSDRIFSISLNDAGLDPVSLVLVGVIDDVKSTASLTAVPEPGNLPALSGLVLAGGFMRGRRHAAAPRNK